eukprot:1013575-Amphidinium_carterae.1
MSAVFPPNRRSSAKTAEWFNCSMVLGSLDCPPDQGKLPKPIEHTAPEPNSDVSIQIDHLRVPVKSTLLACCRTLSQDVRAYVLWRAPSSPWGVRTFSGVHLGTTASDPRRLGHDRLQRVRASAIEGISEADIITFCREAWAHGIFDPLKRVTSITGLSQSSCSSPTRSTRARLVALVCIPVLIRCSITVPIL